MAGCCTLGNQEERATHSACCPQRCLFGSNTGPPFASHPFHKAKSRNSSLHSAIHTHHCCRTQCLLAEMQHCILPWVLLCWLRLHDTSLHVAVCHHPQHMAPCMLSTLLPAIHKPLDCKVELWVAAACRYISMCLHHSQLTRSNTPVVSALHHRTALSKGCTHPPASCTLHTAYHCTIALIQGQNPGHTVNWPQLILLLRGIGLPLGSYLLHRQLSMSPMYLQPMYTLRHCRIARLWVAQCHHTVS